MGEEGNSFVPEDTFDNIWWDLVVATGISCVEAGAAAKHPTRPGTVS